MKAALGAVSATGTGDPEFDVSQNVESGLTALNACQPAGSAGGVTLSKFSDNAAAPPHGVGVGVAVPPGVGVGVGVPPGVGVGPQTPLNWNVSIAM